MKTSEISTTIFEQLADRKLNNDWAARQAQIGASLSGARVSEMQHQLMQAMTQASSKRIKISKIWKIADQAGTVKRPYVACKPGCDSCCHMQIEIPATEAKLIAEHIGVPAVEFKPGVHTTKANTLGRADTPCPFLVDHQCSIYEARPFMCRDMAVLDRDALACSFENMALERENDGRALPVPQSQTEPLHMALATLVVNTDAFADIRQFFPNGRGKSGQPT